MSADEKEIVEQTAASDIPEPPTISDAAKPPLEPIATTEPPLSIDVEKPAAEAADAAAPASDNKSVALPAQPRERRSRWESSFVALRYLSGIGQDTQIKVRDSDRATSFGLLAVAIMTMVSLFFPALADYRFNMLAACDLLAGVSVVFYIANRFGILSTLPPRAALLCWQLMLGAWFIGMYVTINVVLIGFLNQHLPPVPDTQPVHVLTPPPPAAVPAPPARHASH